MGDWNNWKASTLTLFPETDFRGENPEVLHDFNRGDEFDFKPRYEMYFN